MKKNRKLRISVEEFTSPSPLTVGPEATLDELISLMKDNNFRHVPVVDNGQAIGIISERDVQVFKRLATNQDVVARDIMTPGPLTVKPYTPLEDAAMELSRYKIGSALVVDDQNELVGIFTSTDALNALIEVIRGDVSPS